MRALKAAAGVVVVVVAGCTPAPVTAFEDFYQATTRKDVPAFRALLCDEARAAVAAAADATVLAAFSVTRVVQHVSVLEQSERKAVLDVQDATGQHSTVTLERFQSKAGWCVSGKQEGKQP